MDTEKRPIYINITAINVIKILALLFLFYILFLVRDVLAIFFIALILASGLGPLVDWMQSKKIPRTLGVIIIYVILNSIIVSVIFLAVPPIVQEFKDLSVRLPDVIERLRSGLDILHANSENSSFFSNIENTLRGTPKNLPAAAGDIFSGLLSFFGGIFTFFLTLVITFYMAVEEDALKKIVWSVIPGESQVYVMGLIKRMQLKVGHWMRGQLILSLIIFIFIFTGLSILGVEYALILALIAGLVEFVPYLGPIIASIPAIFLAFTQDPALAIFVAILYYVVQVVENNIIVPKIMQKAVGLNPVISIVVLLMGFKLAGVAGAILAIPVATIVSVFLQDVFQQKTVS